MYFRLLLSVVSMVVLVSGTAQAQTLPTISHGANPYRSFVGQFPTSGSETLLEIPEGQDFIITMMYNESENLKVYRDGVAILTLPMLYKSYGQSGRARWRVEGGATLSIRRESTWSTSNYYLQGYLAEAGSPHRFVHSRTPGGGTHTVWTAEEDRDFIIRTMIVGTSWCEFEQGGVPISFSSFPFSGGTSTAFGMGRGTLVLQAGQSLTLTHGMEGEPCEYFIEGAYVQP
jgi:hypothetical protein